MLDIMFKQKSQKKTINHILKMQVEPLFKQYELPESRIDFKVYDLRALKRAIAERIAEITK